jgi:hypothetical protein
MGEDGIEEERKFNQESLEGMHGQRASEHAIDEFNRLSIPLQSASPIRGGIFAIGQSERFSCTYHYSNLFGELTCAFVNTLLPQKDIQHWFKQSDGPYFCSPPFDLQPLERLNPRSWQ